MKKNATTFLAASLVSLALAPAAPAAENGAVAGRFAPGQIVSAPEEHAPAHVSRAFVKTVTVNAERAVAEVPATGCGSLVVWVIPAHAAPSVAGSFAARRMSEEGLATRLATPSGRVLDRGDAGSTERGMRRFELEGFGPEELGLDLPGRQEVFHLSGTEAGLHTLEVRTGAAAVTVVGAEPTSPLTLAAWAGPLSRRPGEPLTLHAELLDDGRPVAAARVVARLAAPGRGASPEVVLFDDGRHGDGAAGDGVYAATLPALPDEAAAGFWSVRFDADGQDAAGNLFARTSSSGFMNERELARFDASSVSARLAGEGEAARVLVEVKVDVAVPGAYRLDVVAANAANRKGLGWGELTRTLDAGSTSLTIEVPVGPAAVRRIQLDVRLIGLDVIGVAGRTVVDLKI